MVEYDPQMMTASGLNQRDRIQILLAEYSGLRSEINTRTGFGFQITAIGAAAITWLIQLAIFKFNWTVAITLATTITFIVAVLCKAWQVNGRDIWRAARRLRELENEINSRAGEQLLVWETLWGPAGRMELSKSFFDPLNPLDRSKLAILDPKYIQRDQATAQERRK